MAGLFEIEPVAAFALGRPGDRGGPARAEAQRAGSRCRAPSTARWPATPACRARSPSWCRTTTTTTPRSSAPTMPSAEIAARRRAGFERLSRALRAGARARSSAPPRPAAHISDLQFTESYRVPFQFSPRVRAAAAGGLVRRVVGGRAGHRSRRQRPLRPHRLLRRQPVRLRLLQGLHGARRGPRRRARPGAGPLPVAGRRQRRAAGAHLRQGRGLVPHVGDGGGHAGRAARPLSHRPQPRSCASAAPITAGGATCSRASATRCRRTRPTRWPTCPKRTLRRAAHRGATSPACWSTRCRRMYPNSGAPADSTLVAAAPDRASIAPPTRPG